MSDSAPDRHIAVSQVLLTDRAGDPETVKMGAESSVIGRGARPLTLGASAGRPAAVVAAREGRVLLVIVCAPLVGFLNAIALVPVLSVVAPDLGTSVAALGQVTALSMALATALGLVAGQFADRYGYRRLLVVGVSTVVVSAMGSAVAPNFAVLLIASLVGAVSRAVVAPISLTIAGTWFDGTARERAISLVSAAIAGAAVVGVPLMTLVTTFWSWRVAFLALGAVAASVVVLAWRGLPKTPAAPSSGLGLRHILGAYRPLLGDRPTMSILGSTLLRSTSSWAVGTYIATFLVLERNLTVQQASRLGPLVKSLITSIVDLGNQNHGPGAYVLRDYVEAGGLLCYGVRLSAGSRRSATFVDKILRGATPAELPVEQNDVFDLSVNAKTLAALGLTLPPDVMALVTEWIQ